MKMSKTDIYPNLRNRFYYKSLNLPEKSTNVMCPLPDKIDKTIKKEIEDDCKKSIKNLKELKLGDLTVYDTQIKMYEFILEELKNR